jgi:hypothetical protein
MLASQLSTALLVLVSAVMPKCTPMLDLRT